MPVVVDITLRQKGGEDVSKAVKRLQADFDNTGKAIDRSQKQAAGLQRELKDIGRALDAVDTAAFKQLDEQINSTRKTTEKATKAVRELREESERPVRIRNGGGTPAISLAEQRRRAAFEASDPVGDVDTGIAAFAGAVGQFGGAGLEQGLRGVSDVLAITEAAPRIVTSLATIPPAMVATAGVLGAGAVAFYALNKAIDASAESAKRDIEAIEQRIAAEQKSREDLRTLSTDETRQRIADLQEDITATRQARAELDRLRDAARDAGGEGLVDNFGQFTDRVVRDISLLGERVGADLGSLGELNKALDEQNQNLKEQKAELDRLLAVERELAAIESGRTTGETFFEVREQQLNAELQTARDVRSLSLESAQQQRDEIQARLDANTLTRQQAIEQRELLQAQLDAIPEPGSVTLLGEEIEIALDEETRNRRAALQAQLDVINQQLDADSQFQQSIRADTAEVERFNEAVIPAVERREQENQRLERFTQLQERATTTAERASDAFEKVVNAQQALADFEAGLQLEQHNKEREASIMAVYDAQLLAIDAEIEAAKAADAATKQRQKQADFEVKAAQRLNDLRAEFATEEIRRQRDFHTELRRFSEDTAREAKRLFEDAEKTIQGAVADNDFAAFIEAVEQRDTDLQRLAEDADTESKRRIKDFNTESKDRLADLVNNLRQTELEIQQEHLRIQAEAGTQELTLLDQLQAKRAEILANRELSLEQFRQQLENEALIRRRQSFIAQINAANEEYNRLNELAMTSGRVIGSNFMTSIIAGTQSQIQHAFTAVSNFGNNILSAIPSFAEGTNAITRPTLAMVGDMHPPFDAEAIIPYRRSDGFGLPGRGGGMTNVFDFSNTNFGNSSRAEIEGIVNEKFWRVEQALRGQIA